MEKLMEIFVKNPKYAIILVSSLLGFLLLATEVKEMDYLKLDNMKFNHEVTIK